MVDANPLSKLVVDEGAVDLDALSSAIAPFASIAKGGGQPIWSPHGSTLTDQKKVLVCLLVAEASHILGISSEMGEGKAALMSQTGASEASIKQSLQRLKKERFVCVDGASWCIVRPNIHRAARYLLDQSG